MRRAVDSALFSLSILGLAIILAGCGGSAATSAPGSAATTAPSGGSGDWSLMVDITSGGNGATASVSPADGWPAGAEADVPAFPGHLDNLIPQRRHTAYGLGVRMLFSGVTKDQFAAYLDELRTAGYHLQGVVYYSAEDGQAAARQRANSGDYDAVIATKDTRNLTITVPSSGDGGVTFDLDGLTLAESDALDVVAWPSAWADLPAPDWCPLKPLDLPNITDASLTIYCRYGTTDQSLNDQAVQAYLVTLTGRGFHLTDTTASYYELNNGPIDVKVHPNTPDGMEIEAKK